LLLKEVYVYFVYFSNEGLIFHHNHET
jgi:hypothetical protein